MSIKQLNNNKLGFCTLLIISLISILSISLSGTVKLMQLHVNYSTKKFNIYKNNLKTKSSLYLIPSLLNSGTFQNPLYDTELNINEILEKKEHYYNSTTNILVLESIPNLSGIIYLSPTQFIALTTNQNIPNSPPFGYVYRSMYLGIIKSEIVATSNLITLESMQKI
ncbi:hypothetical protein HOH45_07125 [bacterium]|jgi:hypothetical protein|nr:hypothetical protein [bacterium]